MAPQLDQRRYELPPDGQFAVLGPYPKPPEMALTDYPKGTDCWYVILKWRGMELFVARDSEHEVMVAAAEKLLQLAALSRG